MEFWNEIKEIFEIIITDISTYVHSALALDIDKLLGDLVRECSDYIIYILRDFFDIFGV